MRERDIERKVCGRVLLEYGVHSAKLSVAGQAGYPDRIFWLPGGKPLLIEFKSPGGVVSPRQQRMHAQLHAAGYQVEVHSSIETAMEAIAMRLRLRGISARDIALARYGS